MTSPDGHRTSNQIDPGVYCPECKARIVQKGMDGKMRLRIKLLVIDPETGLSKAVCKRCGGEVPVDIRAGEALIKALGSPRLVIKPVESS